MQLLALLVANLLLAAAPPDAPTSAISVENCEFGETYAFSDSGCEIALENESDKPVRVLTVTADLPKDSVGLHELTIAPHSHAYIPVRINTDNISGYSKHAFHFRTDEAGIGELRAIAQGFVLSVLDQPTGGLDFGVMDVGGDLTEKSISLDSKAVAEFRVLKILEQPAWLDAHIAPDGHTVTARLRADAPWGVHAEPIKLAINTPQQKQAWIPVKVDVHGDIVPSINPLDMGLLRSGNQNKFRIPLTSRSGKLVEISKVDVESVKGQTQVLPCQPDVFSCRWLEFTVTKDQPIGVMKGNLWVTFKGNAQRLQIPLHGWMVGQDLKIRSLEASDLSGEKSNATNGTPSSFGTSYDLNRAIKNAVQQTDETPISGSGPLLKWTVSNGHPIHGFQIFRSTSEDGSFVLQNKETIQAKADDNEPLTYQWRDNAAEPGKTYWYYIGIVYNDGHKQQLTGPQKVIAK